LAVTISVCIATFRRLDRLHALLEDLAKQTLLPDEVVIIDNDAAGSARKVVEDFKTKGCPFKIIYDIQPERSISVTRNMTVHRSSGEWLAFIDDDERAPPEWLERLMGAALHFKAESVQGPVEPVVPDSAPTWIRQGRFYDWPHLATGEVVYSSNLRFGNILIAGAPLRTLEGPFDPAFGLSTGEDREMLMRLVAHGAKVIWCDEAPVFEPVEEKRLSLAWLLQRSYSGGQYFGRLVITGRLGHATILSRVLQGLLWSAQCAAALFLSAISWPLGRHRAAYWLMKVWANWGKLSAFLGWKYGEYA
jgi:succinoglycan biosynthesis protein ExoM